MQVIQREKQTLNLQNKASVIVNTQAGTGHGWERLTNTYIHNFFNSFYWTKQINFHFSHIQIKTVLYSEQYFLLSNVFPGANRLLDISILPQNSNHLTKPLYNFYSTILAVHLKYQSTVI